MSRKKWTWRKFITMWALLVGMMSSVAVVVSLIGGIWSGDIFWLKVMATAGVGLVVGFCCLMATDYE